MFCYTEVSLYFFCRTGKKTGLPWKKPSKSKKINRRYVFLIEWLNCNVILLMYCQGRAWRKCLRHKVAQEPHYTLPEETWQRSRDQASRTSSEESKGKYSNNPNNSDVWFWVCCGLGGGAHQHQVGGGERRANRRTPGAAASVRGR